MSLVEVRMITQMSGTGPNGQSYPPPGQTFLVSEEEAAVLCFTSTASDTPIAVRVERPKSETATAPEAGVETRPGPAEDAVERDVPPEPVKRGPGRPPGSTNKPK